MKTIILIFLTFICITVKAQPTSPRFESSDGKVLGAKKYANVEGSPYLSEEWQRGSFKTASGKTMDNVDLRYDIAEDLLVFKGADNEPMFLSERVASFKIDAPSGSRTFVNGFSPVDKITDKSYLEEIALGELSLYKRYTIAIIDSKGYGSNAVSALFNQNSSYYIKKGSGGLSKFSPSKKSLIALLPEKESEISTYLKTEKIDLKKDSDLKKVFDYINTLK